jgi:hypothetical protein
MFDPHKLVMGLLVNVIAARVQATLEANQGLAEEIARSGEAISVFRMIELAFPGFKIRSIAFEKGALPDFEAESAAFKKVIGELVRWIAPANDGKPAA